MIIDATVETKIKVWNSKKNSSGLVPIYVVTQYGDKRKFKSTKLWIKPSHSGEILPLLNHIFNPESLPISLSELLEKYDCSQANKTVIEESIKRFKELLGEEPHTVHLTLNNLLKLKKMMVEKSNSDSSISIRLRCLRTLFNYSKSIGLHKMENPFIRGLIPTPKPKKKVVKWILPDNEIYKLQLLLGGVDFVDVIMIIRKRLGIGYHDYIRYKNRRKGTLQRIYITVKAYSLIKSLYNYVSNKSLQTLRRKQNNLLKPYGLTSKSPRYQIAQKLQSINCPKEIISEILGHSKNDVTERYLNDFDTKEWIKKINDLVVCPL